MDGGESFDAVIDSPVGRLGIQMQGKALSRLVFLSARHRLIEADTEQASEVLCSLKAYFENPGQTLEVAVQLSGTPFQHRVWQGLSSIPVGKIMTYGALAARLRSSARAVGNACRRNPVPIVVPCHRVVAANGLGGFAGDSQGRLVSVKRCLLEHEGVEIRGRHPHISARLPTIDRSRAY
ncbi:MAG: methylated-DNA--[protein]-cysteine S-methyltransferase [Pseudomonadota bacterium]|nr:methylated-DNA--[protein]-cysteine S-methyltransferase [Pseudomonadota bacterium]